MSEQQDDRPFAGTAEQVAESVARESADSEPAAEPVLADEVKALPNGQIRLHVNGQLFLLRTPNMGQLRRYREAYIDLAKQEAARLDELSEQSKAASTGDLDAILAVADNGMAEELVARSLDLFREIVSDLDVAHRRLPQDNDELPSWMPNIGLITSFIQHWRRTPQAPGR